MIKQIGIESLKNYNLDTESKVIKSPYSPLVNKLGFIKENVLCTVVKDGVIEVGDISLDETLSYKAELTLSKSDVGFDIKKGGVKYVVDHHIEKAYHKALSTKLNAITGTVTDLTTLISKASVNGGTLFLSVTDYEKLQALTPATTPRGLSNLEILVIEGLDKPCIALLDEIAGKCIIDVAQAEQDAQMIREGKEITFINIYLGIELLGNVIK